MISLSYIDSCLTSKFCISRLVLSLPNKNISNHSDFVSNLKLISKVRIIGESED